jgi:hypothetical protein
MEEFFAQIGKLFQGLLALADGGFDGVNQVVGLLIAGVFGLFLMAGWKAIWASSLGAVVVHTLIEALRPVLDGGAFLLPPLTEVSFWISRFALFLGYAIAIAVFFFLKTALTGGGKKKAHAH